jgi:hypothetical protein
MSEAFFNNPILNSPYAYPNQHWELDKEGQPTQAIIPSRRIADFITPIPKAKKRKGKADQQELVMDEGEGLSSEDQQYTASSINRLREHIDLWRKLSNPSDWKVTPETARLLQHWRHFEFQGIRPFFCQVEAVETLIWLTEVAPKSGNLGKGFLEHLEKASLAANPELLRIALKLATGAGKTTVMAMIIAWQTINAVRRPTSRNFTRGFLVVAPGITIRDRLRVLLPNDSESYYESRQLVPTDMLPEIGKAKIVITNYHAFKLRERMELAKGNRALLQGHGPQLSTLETEGQMLQRVMPDLMGLKNVVVLNDEAHHCYREKPGEDDTGELKGDDREEAEKNNEAARLWISGLEVVKRKLGLHRVVDLSATPFFLRGSGYAEGTLFPWTVSDFSLMDAIECGIVKLPRVPVADNIPGGEMPMFRNLWEHISKKMPKKGRGKGAVLDPENLPTPLKTALDALQITFPRVSGYRVELPTERLSADFNEDAHLQLTPDLVGATRTEQRGIIGEGIDLNLVHTGDIRRSTLLLNLTQRLLYTKYRDPGDEPKVHLFGQLKRITRQWLGENLECKGGTYPAQLMYQELADMACERIAAAIARAGMQADESQRVIKALLDPYNPTGSTAHVNFRTSKESLYQTAANKCHVNWVVLDSDWEAEFCRVAENHPKVLAYVKNHSLGLEVPYRYGAENRKYIPDFIVLVDDGCGPGDPLHLIVEIKGYRQEDAKVKKTTMDSYWIPGVNNHGNYGRWAFAEFTDVWEMQDDFGNEVAGKFEEMIENVKTQPA